jgi:hypothetical protein
MRNFGWETLDYHLHSTDLAPRASYVFVALKVNLSGYRFIYDKEVKRAAVK